MPDSIDLEIFSAFNCVWCYFSTRQIKRLKKKYDVNIVWRAFPLHPKIPPEGLLIEEQFGNNIHLMNEKIALLQQKAEELELPLKERKTISDSRLAQELEKWAETKNKSDAFHEAMNKAYFADGLNISETSVLLEVVESIALPRQKAEIVIERRKFKAAVDYDWRLSEKLGIMAAPSYVINQDKLIGPQSNAVLENFLECHGVSKREQT